ncbi:hypothetical protein B0H11DRAFT_2224493 [Mycena galericulata]|nr:hypothetical protein B0H11DRAFT_2224493 [Mycena galericulata]
MPFMNMGRMASLEMGGTKKWMSDDEWGAYLGRGRVCGVGERWEYSSTTSQLASSASASPPLYAFPQCVSIAGEPPSSSYYVFGAQGGGLFSLDPHHSRLTVPLPPARIR